MKKTLIPFMLLCVIATAVAVSCKKNSNSGSAPTKSLNLVFADLRSTPQNFTVQAGRDTVVYGAKGTILHFYPKSFKDEFNSTITNGTISMQLVEMYNAGDMIQNRATTTMTNGKLLQSGGQLNIKATKNGKKVFANTYGVGFKQPTGSTLPMSLYYGNTNNPDSTVQWGNAATGTGATTTRTDTVGPETTNAGFPFFGGYYYLLDSCTNFDFINCDLLYDNSGENTTVKVKLPDNSFLPSNTQIFLVLPPLNAITTSDYRQQYDAATNTFTLGNHENEVPVGMAYKIIVIANKNGSYYYSQVSGTTSKDMEVDAPMAPETRGDIIARLAGL